MTKGKGKTQSVNCSSVVARLQQEWERVRYSVFMPSQTVMETMQSHLRDANRIASLYDLAKHAFLTDISSTTQQLILDMNRENVNRNNILGVSSIYEATKALELSHPSWLKDKDIFKNSAVEMAALASEQLLEANRYNLATRRMLTNSYLDSLYLSSGMDNFFIRSVQDTYKALDQNYHMLCASFKSLPDLSSLPTYVIPGSSHELFLTGYTIRIIDNNIEDDEEDENFDAFLPDIRREVSVCQELLKKLNPALVKSYEGARTALRSNNPDRVRHVLISLRELCTRIIKNLAPDDDVIKWIQDSVLLHKGKPTRRERIQYIYKNISHDCLGEFAAADVNAVIKLFDVFQRVHEINPTITQTQLQTIFLRTESLLTFILKSHSSD